MSKLNIVKKYFPSLPLLIAVLIFIVILQIRGCDYPDNFAFDTQNIFYWRFMDQLGVVPIKDLYYPHGLITFYNYSKLGFKFIYSALPAVYFLIIYQVLYMLYDGSKRTVWMLVLFYSFIILNLVKLDGHVRYGMLLYPGVLSTYLLSVYKSRLIYFLLGFISGIVVYFELGVGLNLLVLNFAMILFDVYYRKHDIKHFTLVTRKLVYFTLGLGLGVLPTIAFIIKNGAFSEYYYFLIDISSFSVFAKSLINYTDRTNLFLLLMYFLNIAFVARSIKLNFKGEKKLYYYLLFSAFFSSSLVMMKFYSRQMSGVAPFLLINLLILIYPTYRYLKDKYSSLGTACFTLIVLMMFLLINYSILRSVKISAVFTDLGSTLSEYKWPSKYPLVCDVNKLDESYLQLNLEYIDIYEYLKNEHNGKGIFFFPKDPVFYAYLGLAPPPYPTTWESSPDYAQQKNIDFIKKNNINTVVYNLNYPSQDGVPDYVRSKTLHSYLMTGFSPIYKNDTFVVMQRNKDYFLRDDNLINVYRKLYDKNLNVDFGHVFYLEGKYKGNWVLESSEVIKESTNIGDIISELNDNKESWDSLVLLTKHGSEKRGTIDFVISEKLISTVSFNTCNDFYCLLKLNNIPIFYEPTDIRIIEDRSEITEVKLLKVSKINGLW